MNCIWMEYTYYMNNIWMKYPCYMTNIWTVCTFYMNNIWMMYSYYMTCILFAYVWYISGKWNDQGYTSGAIRYTFHVTGILVVYDHIYVIYMSYERYKTDKSMSYDNVSRMTGIYPLNILWAFSVPVTLRFGPIICLSYDRHMIGQYRTSP